MHDHWSIHFPFLLKVLSLSIWIFLLPWLLPPYSSLLPANCMRVSSDSLHSFSILHGRPSRFSRFPIICLGFYFRLAYPILFKREDTATMMRNFHFFSPSFGLHFAKFFITTKLRDSATVPYVPSGLLPVLPIAHTNTRGLSNLVPSAKSGPGSITRAVCFPPQDFHLAYNW